MEFILKENHRNINKDEMIEDIVRVAKALNTTSLTQKQYKLLGKYDVGTIAKRFNGWSNALDESGLIPLKKSIKPRYRSVSSEEIISDIQAVAEKLNVDTLTSSTYDLYGKYNHNSVTKKYGSWNNALSIAGLKATGYHRNISEEDLLENIEHMWVELGRQPTIRDITSGLSAFGAKVYYKRYGSWSAALKRFIEYVNYEDSEDGDYVTDNTQIPVDTLKASVTNKLTHKTKRDISLRLRFNVMRRDNFKCCMCGASPATNPSVVLHIDHIVPWSKGGETTFDNLQTLCSNCNLGKGNLI